MYLFPFEKFSRRTKSSLILASIIGVACSSSLIANASEADSTAAGMAKKMPPDHMTVDHKNMPTDHKNMTMDHKHMATDHKHMAMTGDVDYDFAMMMRMHHEKGIKMAQKELDQGKDSDLRAAAKNIVETQTTEMAEFDKWLLEHPAKAK